MTTNPSPPAASEAKLAAMSQLVRDMQSKYPDSILTYIKPGSLRVICQAMIADVPDNASREKVFAVALRTAGWYPDDFSASFPALKELTPHQLHEFSNRGTLPKKRRGQK